MRMFEAAIGVGIRGLFWAGRQLATGVVGAGNRSGQVRDNVVILSWCLRGGVHDCVWIPSRCMHVIVGSPSKMARVIEAVCRGVA